MKIDELNPAEKIAFVLALLCRTLEHDMEPGELAKATQLNVDLCVEEEPLAHNLAAYALKVLETSGEDLVKNRENFEQEAEHLASQLNEFNNVFLITTFSFLCAYVQGTMESLNEYSASSFRV